ncbi:IclR family transcriptional regulator [uncultured Sphingomonas sp.]|uniref:IclR family transcriptional regulator n=1 Tax=uncultured Sphingomonas sp. TaxID=158754 RepID=UPI0035CBBEC5
MRPVDLAFQLIELLGIHQPAGVSELARLAGIPRSTAQRTLQALHKTGWIEPAGAETTDWVISMRAVIATGRTNHALARLRLVALPVMEELRRVTEETVHLTCRFERALVLVERLDGIKPVRYFFPYGGVVPLHATASGQAMLAHFDDAELDLYLKEPLESTTQLTITDRSELEKRIAVARKRGYATGFGGNHRGVNAVGAAIIDRMDDPVGAISISGPGARLDERRAEEIGGLLVDATRRISMALI